MNQLKETISAIGQKRFTLLVVLAVICTLLGGAWQKVMLPQHQQLTGEISSVQGERSRIQKEITELPVRHALLEANENRYNALKQSGFFVNQDRIEARARMDILRDEAMLNSISYKIEPQKIMENTNFTSETEEIVMSQINVDINSMTDLEALNFIERMQGEFSGLVVLKGLKLERKEEPTPETLGKISRGEVVDMVTGNAKFDWYSIIPKSSSVSTPLSQTFEGSLK